MSNVMRGLVSIYGRALQAAHNARGFVSFGKKIVMQGIDADVTVGDESTNVVAVTVQLKRGDGVAVDERHIVNVFITDDANGDTPSTASPSTGLAAGTDGCILSTVEAHKHYVCMTEADGDLDLTWTDTGADTVYIHVQLPTGAWVSGSQAIATT